MNIRQLSVFCSVVMLLTATSSASVGFEGSLPIEEGTEDYYMMAGVTMPFAIDVALESNPGTAIDAELEVEQGYLVYAVDVLSPEGVETEVLIDAGNGNLLLAMIEDEEGEDEEGEEEDVEPDPGMTHTEVALTEAVRIALDHHPGVALEAWLEKDEEEPSFEVVLVDAEGSTFEVVVNAMTGELFEDEPDEVEPEEVETEE